MNAKEFMQHIESLGACPDAKDWALGKSWQEVYDTCHRGDWLLWLYRKSKGYDFQKLTLAKGLCANTVRHLMKHQRSLQAVDAAIAFGRGEISKNELDAAYPTAAYAVFSYSAYAAACAAYAAPADAAAYAAYAADAAYVDAAADAAEAAAAYAAYSYSVYSAVAADAARKENQQKTADIVRDVLPFENWEL